ncbi:MAG TPA: tRNA adenosine(34) deaminase TadA [Actinomycetota bacterium]
MDAPDERIMRLALEAARAAAAGGDVPVGAVIVRGDEILARAGNARERELDPTAHAEILALRRASGAIGSWHLEGCAMVVTLEPCAMCAGAIVLARLDRLVFGASDPKAGFAGSLGNLVRDGRLNHEVDVTVGVLADECGEVLRAFFADRRS